MQRPDIVEQAPGQREFVQTMLSGSQAKTAFALRMNCERMVKEAGLECIGFLTLTVGEFQEEETTLIQGKNRRFVQVRDAAEASRRLNNLNRRILPELFEKAVVVTERHRSGAIHFHVLGVIRGRPDIRTGLNFEKIKMRDYRSVPEPLRDIWAWLREVLPGYGFGRAELLPVRKTGEAVAAYVSKYIEKNVCNRLKEDKGKKLVRYLNWNKAQLKPNDFSWAGERARAWRGKARAMAALVDITEKEECSQAFGPRWANLFTRLWIHAGQEDLNPFMLWNFAEKETVRRWLVNFSREAWNFATKKRAEI